MSTLWTPDGERPVGGPTDTGGGRARRAGRRDGDDAGAPPDGAEPTVEEVEAMRAELARAPVETVVANHCYGLFELAAVYLSQQPPLLHQARLAIDALGSMLGGLEGRLGDGEEQLKDGLSQLRLAYVQIEGAKQAGTGAARSAGANGDAPKRDGELDDGGAVQIQPGE
ncbi:MAG: hypothetical protein ACYCVN_13695 [Acidimicrobiales bacterium]